MAHFKLTKHSEALAPAHRDLRNIGHEVVRDPARVFANAP